MSDAMPPDSLDLKKVETRAWFEALRDRIHAAFEALEDAAFALPSVLDVRVRLWDDRIEIVLETLSSSDDEPAVPEPLRDMIAAVRSIPVSLVVRGRSEPDLLPRRKRRIERIPGNPTLADPAENDRDPS